MTPAVAHALQMIICKEGLSLLHDRLRLEGLLRDACGQYPRAIWLVLLGVDARVPQQLVFDSANGSLKFRCQRLRHLLETKYFLTKDATTWVVETWVVVTFPRYLNNLNVHSSS